MTQEQDKKLFELDFGVIKDDLDSLFLAVENKIEREWPPHLSTIKGSQTVFLLLMKVATVTYKTIRYVCADKPKDLARKLEYCTSVTPMIRSILDSLFTVIFLFEDLPHRCEWYHKSGWRELKEKLERYRSEYGGQSEWDKFFESFERLVEFTKTDWEISPQEAEQLKSIEYWPLPSQMVRSASSEQNKEFLSYLLDWFYRELSQDAHLSWPGLAVRSIFHVQGEEAQRALEKFKSDCVFITITLVIAIASEIEANLSFGLAERIRYLWGILCEYRGEALTLYEKRYEALLS